MDDGRIPYGHGYLTVYRAPGGFVVRHEIVGKEGDEVPVLVRWSDANTGEFLGLYSRVNLTERPELVGPMFG